MKNDFYAAFQAIEMTTDMKIRASLLAGLCKTYDLREATYVREVAIIAKWIDSQDADLRREVVFALCIGRPVPGFGYLALEGWRRSPPDDLHWYASAIRKSFSTSSAVTLDVVLEVARTLLSAEGAARQTENHSTDGESGIDQELRIRESLHVLSWFHELLFPEVDSATSGTGLTDERSIAWRMIIEVILAVWQRRENSLRTDRSERNGRN